MSSFPNNMGHRMGMRDRQRQRWGKEGGNGQEQKAMHIYQKE